MSIWGTVGQPHSIAITHWDGEEVLHPVAYIYNHADTLLSTLPLVHRAKGYYSICWQPMTEGNYNVVIISWEDAAHTIEHAETQREGRSYFINGLLPSVAALPEAVANQVWDETLPGEHDLADSAGLYMQVIRHTVLDTFWEVKSDPTWSLPILEQKIQNSRNILQAAIEYNESKIDALASQNSSENLDAIAEIQLNRSTLNAHDAHLSTVQTDLTAEINENEIKIDSIISAIQQIQNNTRFVAVVPQKMRIPDVGAKTYQFFLAIYDVTGAPAAPDQLPRVRIVTSSGTEILPFTNMSQDGVKVGQYYYDYSINLTTPEQILRIEFEVVEDSVTSYLSRTSETIIYDSNLDVIENKIDVIDSNVDDIKSEVTGANGLSVIDTKIDALNGEINQNETLLNQIKTKTDQIINNAADKDDITDIRDDITNIPDSIELQDRLDNQTSSIKGVGNYDLTQVYDNERGTDNALLANDPRLNFLDVAISTRSSHNVADIWSAATRTLTDAPPLSNTEIAKIWDHLVTNITTAGSIGKYLLDTLDTPVSTRSTLTQAQLINALSPIALESTLSQIISLVQNENNENEIKLNDIIACLDLVKPQTDKIVEGGAQQISMENEIGQNRALIEGLELLINTVKAKTDLLHNDLAYQSTLEQIPTNPLLSTDNRLDYLYNLSRLDVDVSTRAESFPTDYAKAVALESVKDDIIVEVNVNESLINQLPTDTDIDAKLVRLDNILVSLGEIKGSGFDTLLHSLVKIKEGQSGGSCTPISAQDVWEYASRELTSYPDAASPEDVNNARDAILTALPELKCHMTTTFITQSDIQEVLCWLDKDGQTVAATTNARIVVSNGVSDIWSGSDLTPDARGIFRISQTDISTLINSADKNFVMSITIEHGGQDYTTTQPFYTVG